MSCLEFVTKQPQVPKEDHALDRAVAHGMYVILLVHFLVCSPLSSGRWLPLFRGKKWNACVPMAALILVKSLVVAFFSVGCQWTVAVVVHRKVAHVRGL